MPARINLSFKITLLANNSIKPWAEISGLRSIFLVPAGSKVDPADFPLPKIYPNLKHVITRGKQYIGAPYPKR